MLNPRKTGRKIFPLENCLQCIWHRKLQEHVLMRQEGEFYHYQILDKIICKHIANNDESPINICLGFPDSCPLEDERDIGTEIIGAMAKFCKACSSQRGYQTFLPSPFIILEPDEKGLPRIKEWGIDDVRNLEKKGFGKLNGEKSEDDDYLTLRLFIPCLFFNITILTIFSLHENSNNSLRWQDIYIFPDEENEINTTQNLPTKWDLIECYERGDHGEDEEE